MSLPPGERVASELAAEGLPTPDIVIEPDGETLARAAAEALVARLAAAQTVHGTASVVHWDGAEDWVRIPYEGKSALARVIVDPAVNVTLDQNLFNGARVTKDWKNTFCWQWKRRRTFNLSFS